MLWIAEPTDSTQVSLNAQPSLFLAFAFFAAAGVIGLLPAMFVFLVGYMRFHGKESWKVTLAIAVPMWIGSYALFHRLLIVPWPPSLMGQLFPGLKSNIWLNLF